MDDLELASLLFGASNEEDNSSDGYSYELFYATALTDSKDGVVTIQIADPYYTDDDEDDSEYAEVYETDDEEDEDDIDEFEDDDEEETEDGIDENWDSAIEESEEVG